MAHPLGRVGDHHAAFEGLPDQLLAQQRAAAALDQGQGRADLVGAVDRCQVERSPAGLAERRGEPAGSRARPGPSSSVSRVGTHDAASNPQPPARRVEPAQRRTRPRVEGRCRAPRSSARHAAPAGRRPRRGRASWSSALISRSIRGGPSPAFLDLRRAGKRRGPRRDVARSPTEPRPRYRRRPRSSPAPPGR